VPPEDTERLYTMLRELREEVVGYRADLNGRLRALETAEAHRQGADYGKGSVGRLVAGTAALAAAIAGVITATLTYV
jgi:hypothetical protein